MMSSPKRSPPVEGIEEEVLNGDNTHFRSGNRKNPAGREPHFAVKKVDFAGKEVDLAATQAEFEAKMADLAVQEAALDVANRNNASSIPSCSSGIPSASTGISGGISSPSTGISGGISSSSTGSIRGISSSSTGISGGISSASTGSTGGISSSSTGISGGICTFFSRNTGGFNESAGMNGRAGIIDATGSPSMMKSPSLPQAVSKMRSAKFFPPLRSSRSNMVDTTLKTTVSPIKRGASPRRVKAAVLAAARAISQAARLAKVGPKSSAPSSLSSKARNSSTAGNSSTKSIPDGHKLKDGMPSVGNGVPNAAKSKSSAGKPVDPKKTSSASAEGPKAPSKKDATSKKPKSVLTKADSFSTREDRVGNEGNFIANSADPTSKSDDLISKKDGPMSKRGVNPGVPKEGKAVSRPAGSKAATANSKAASVVTGEKATRVAKSSKGALFAKSPVAKQNKMRGTISPLFSELVNEPMQTAFSSKTTVSSSTVDDSQCKKTKKAQAAPKPANEEDSEPIMSRVVAKTTVSMGKVIPATTLSMRKATPKQTVSRKATLVAKAANVIKKVGNRVATNVTQVKMAKSVSRSAGSSAHVSKAAGIAKAISVKKVDAEQEFALEEEQPEAAAQEEGAFAKVKSSVVSKDNAKTKLTAVRKDGVTAKPKAVSGPRSEAKRKSVAKVEAKSKSAPKARARIKSSAKAEAKAKSAPKARAKVKSIAKSETKPESVPKAEAQARSEPEDDVKALLKRKRKRTKKRTNDEEDVVVDIVEEDVVVRTNKRKEIDNANEKVIDDRVDNSSAGDVRKGVWNYRNAEGIIEMGDDIGSAKRHHIICTVCRMGDYTFPSSSLIAKAATKPAGLQSAAKSSAKALTKASASKASVTATESLQVREYRFQRDLVYSPLNLKCSNCPRSYHLCCLGIKKLPLNSWSCPSCGGPDTARKNKVKNVVYPGDRHGREATALSLKLDPNYTFKLDRIVEHIPRVATSFTDRALDWIRNWLDCPEENDGKEEHIPDSNGIVVGGTVGMLGHESHSHYNPGVKPRAGGIISKSHGGELLGDTIGISAGSCSADGELQHGERRPRYFLRTPDDDRSWIREELGYKLLVNDLSDGPGIEGRSQSPLGTLLQTQASLFANEIKKKKSDTAGGIRIQHETTLKLLLVAEILFKRGCLPINSFYIIHDGNPRYHVDPADGRTYKNGWANALNFIQMKMFQVLEKHRIVIRKKRTIPYTMPFMHATTQLLPEQAKELPFQRGNEVPRGNVRHSFGPSLRASSSNNAGIDTRAIVDSCVGGDSKTNSLSGPKSLTHDQQQVMNAIHSSKLSYFGDAASLAKSDSLITMQESEPISNAALTPFYGSMKGAVPFNVFSAFNSRSEYSYARRSRHLASLIRNAWDQHPTNPYGLTGTPTALGTKFGPRGNYGGDDRPSFGDFQEAHPSSGESLGEPPSGSFGDHGSRDLVGNLPVRRSIRIFQQLRGEVNRKSKPQIFGFPLAHDFQRTFPAHSTNSPTARSSVTYNLIANQASSSAASSSAPLNAASSWSAPTSSNLPLFGCSHSENLGGPPTKKRRLELPLHEDTSSARSELGSCQINSSQIGSSQTAFGSLTALSGLASSVGPDFGTGSNSLEIGSNTPRFGDNTFTNTFCIGNPTFGIGCNTLGKDDSGPGAKYSIPDGSSYSVAFSDDSTLKSTAAVNTGSEIFSNQISSDSASFQTSSGLTFDPWTCPILVKGAAGKTRTVTIPNVCRELRVWGEYLRLCIRADPQSVAPFMLPRHFAYIPDDVRKISNFERRKPYLLLRIKWEKVRVEVEDRLNAIQNENVIQNGLESSTSPQSSASIEEESRMSPSIQEQRRRILTSIQEKGRQMLTSIEGSTSIEQDRRATSLEIQIGDATLIETRMGPLTDEVPVEKDNLMKEKTDGRKTEMTKTTPKVQEMGTMKTDGERDVEGNIEYTETEKAAYYRENMDRQKTDMEKMNRRKAELEKFDSEIEELLTMEGIDLMEGDHEREYAFGCELVYAQRKADFIRKLQAERVFFSRMRKPTKTSIRATHAKIQSKDHATPKAGLGKQPSAKVGAKTQSSAKATAKAASTGSVTSDFGSSLSRRTKGATSHLTPRAAGGMGAAKPFIAFGLERLEWDALYFLCETYSWDIFVQIIGWL